MKRIAAFILALLMALTCCAFAEEKALTQVTYAKVTSSNGGNVNLYQLPGEYRPVLESLANGTSIYVEFQGSTWHRVRTVSGGKIGWIKASEITITTRGLSALNYGSTITAAKTVQSSDGFAALRWGPGFEYDLMDNVPSGTVVWQFDVSGEWTRVLLNDARIGYIHSTLLKKASGTGTAIPGNLYGYVQVTGNSAIYRQSASYSSKSLGTMASGEIIELLGEQGGFWYFHSASRNIYAYISKDIVSPEGINRVTTYATLYYDNPYIYMTDALWDLQAGQAVKVLATDGYISRVQYDNVIGYVVSETLAIHH